MEEKSTQKYPRDVTIFPADNGYLIAIGCQKYVHEGTAETLTADLKKYFELDTEIVKKYAKNWEKQAFIFTGAEPPEDALPAAEKVAEEDRTDPPALTYAEDKLKAKTSVYRVNNGTITLDSIEGTAIVSEDKE